ncbi:unnamed protein product, partial [Brenthis ino]
MSFHIALVNKSEIFINICKLVLEEVKLTLERWAATLEELEQALAQKGLKDPWIRNEAWRYHPGFGTRWQRARKLFFRGLPLGLALTVATVAFDKMTGEDKHGHGHGHGDHH